jgi:hypothetical protein
VGDIELSMSVPLDSDGFLRRECPTCEREFKCSATPDGEKGTPAPDGGYFCPYCAVQAAEDGWWTKAQLEAAQSQAYGEVIKPELDKLADSARRTSGDFISVEVNIDEPDPPPPLRETDDMRRVDFTCHPSDPVKVLDDWDDSVHCLICGSPTLGEPA